MPQQKPKTITPKQKACCRCIDCKHTELHKYGENEPLISSCLIKPRKEVARSLVRCYHFEQRHKNAQPPAIIEHNN